MNHNYLHIKLEDNKLPIYCLGDLHGFTDILHRHIKNNDLKDCILIICGDIGLGLNSIGYLAKLYSNFNNFLKSRNIFVYAFRGNHDDPSYFNRDVNNDDNFYLSNLKLVPDYTVLTVNNENILMIGGAVSIDRSKRKISDKQRIKHTLEFYPKSQRKKQLLSIPLSYWDNELPVFDPKIIDKLTEDGISINYVLTHTCPSFAFPITKDGVKHWFPYDSHLEADLDKERAIMDSIYHYLLDKGHNIKQWIYGHYHTHHQETVNNIRFVTLINVDYDFDAYEIARNDI